MEKFIGKKVLITVAFANLLPGGATPGEFIGILEKIAAIKKVPFLGTFLYITLG